MNENLINDLNRAMMTMSEVQQVLFHDLKEVDLSLEILEAIGLMQQAHDLLRG